MNVYYDFEVYIYDTVREALGHALRALSEMGFPQAMYCIEGRIRQPENYAKLGIVKLSENEFRVAFRFASKEYPGFEALADVIVFRDLEDAQGKPLEKPAAIKDIHTAVIKTELIEMKIVVNNEAPVSFVLKDPKLDSRTLKRLD